MEKNNIITIFLDKKKQIVRTEEKIAKIMKAVTKGQQFTSKFIYLSYDGTLLDPNKSWSYYGLLSDPPQIFHLEEKEKDFFSDEDVKIKVDIIQSGKNIFESEISKYTSIFELKRLLNFEKKGGFQISFNGELLKDWFGINRLLDEEENEKSIIFELILNEDIKINVRIYLNNEICQVFPEVSIGFNLCYFVQTLQKKEQFNIQDMIMMTETQIVNQNNKISDIFLDFTQNLVFFLNDNSKTVLLKFSFQKKTYCYI